MTVMLTFSWSSIASLVLFMLYTNFTSSIISFYFFKHFIFFGWVSLSLSLDYPLKKKIPHEFITRKVGDNTTTYFLSMYQLNSWCSKIICWLVIDYDMYLLFIQWFGNWRASRKVCAWWIYSYYNMVTETWTMFLGAWCYLNKLWSLKFVHIRTMQSKACLYLTLTLQGESSCA